MTKTKILGLLTIILGLFLAAPRVTDAQFPIITACQPPLTTFSDGSATFDISFPPGGGTTCDTIADCPTISLPVGATVFSVKVDMELSDPASEIGTPYIWIPNSGSNTLIQMRTKDMASGASGSRVRIFSNNNDNCANYAFNNPSRITVIPGGDVWIDNRNNDYVTRLGLIDPTVSMEDYECKGSYAVGGAGTNGGGVTFDRNGNVWVGNYHNSDVHKFARDGTLLAGPLNLGSTYGMIGDSEGYVWVSDRSGGMVRWIDIDTNSVAESLALSNIYGIGIDNEGDIWLGSVTAGNPMAYQVAGANNPNGSPIGTDITPGGIPNASTRGVAVDLNNVVWAADPLGNSVWAFDQKTGASLAGSPFLAGNSSRGVAVAFDNNIWVVNYNGGGPNFIDPNPPGTCAGNGTVTKLQSDGTAINTYPTCGNSPYNYSDMTGLRTTPQNLKISGSSTGTPLSNTNTFEVCTDGTVTCTSGLPCAAITAMLGSCIPNAAGNCEIPLKIFSITAGDYTLSNLEVIYGKKVPVTIGGLVPCGRNWDDSRTPWNEKAPCNFCFLLMMINNIMNFLLMLAAGIAVLALIITGLLFVTSSGDSERKSQSKTALKYSIWGFIVIFISWIIVDFLLIGWGYLDPLGGEWNIADCDVSQTFCGDNIRQTPNDYGFYEECDGTDNPCAGACSPACACAFIPPPPPPPPPTSTFCSDGAIQTPNDAGTGGPANDGNEECDTDGSSCGSLVCEADCTCKTDPTPGVCGVWFSGGVAGHASGSCTTPFNLMDNDTPSAQLAEWVGSGNYPDNTAAFPIATYRSFDGIAIDKNTHLELWDGKDYTGTKVVDIMGPAIINSNYLASVVFDGDYLTDCFGLDKTYWTGCQLFDGKVLENIASPCCLVSSIMSMDDWGQNGSCRITCTAP